MYNAWMELLNGRTVNLWNLQPHDLDADTIAHGLGNLCRFGGQVTEFYSVAEHSVLASCLAPEDLRLAALLHDAHEAFLGDLTWPVGQACPEARRELGHMACRIDSVVADRWLRGRCDLLRHGKMREVDLRLRHTEAQQLLPRWTGEGWDEATTHPPYPRIRLRCWPPAEAARRWRERLRDLLLADELRRCGKWFSRRSLRFALLARMVRGSGCVDVYAGSPEQLAMQSLCELQLVRGWFGLRRHGLAATAYLLTGAGCRAGGASWQLTEQLRDYWRTNGLGEFDVVDHDVA